MRARARPVVRMRRDESPPLVGADRPASSARSKGTSPDRGGGHNESRQERRGIYWPARRHAAANEPRKALCSLSRLAGWPAGRSSLHRVAVSRWQRSNGIMTQSKQAGEKFPLCGVGSRRLLLRRCRVSSAVAPTRLYSRCSRLQLSPCRTRQKRLFAPMALVPVAFDLSSTTNLFSRLTTSRSRLV